MQMIYRTSGKDGDFLLAELNVPGRLCSANWVSPHAPELMRVLTQRSGINLIRHSPYVSVQATFILENERDNTRRLFSGTIQRLHRDKNLILDERPIRNTEEFVNLALEAFDPVTLDAALNSQQHFPDSDWVFVGVVSVVFVFNARAQLEFPRNYSKYFFQDRPHLTR